MTSTDHEENTMTDAPQPITRISDFPEPIRQALAETLNETLGGAPGASIPVAPGYAVRFHRTWTLGDNPEVYESSWSWPVIAYESRTGSPVVAWTGTNGRFVTFGNSHDYELVREDPPVVVPAEAEGSNGIAEVITGSDRELDYTLPDGSSYRGVVPLWGRRADGSVVALVTADVVPTRRIVERDPSGDIVATVEDAPAD